MDIPLYKEFQDHHMTNAYNIDLKGIKFRSAGTENTYYKTKSKKKFWKRTMATTTPTPTRYRNIASFVKIIIYMGLCQSFLKT